LLRESNHLNDEHPGLYFTFFVHYFLYHFHEEEFTDKLASLLNQTSQSSDINVQITMDDFMLDLYSSAKEHGKHIEELMNKLDSPAKEIYQKNIDLWTRKRIN
jgi:uncharacterized alkaline shock family protein YloU